MGLFSKKPAPAPTPAASAVTTTAAPRAEWDLTLVLRRVHESAPALEARDIEAALVQARIADHCRDAGLMPADPAMVQKLTAVLDAEDWRRLALAAAALEDANLRGVLANCPAIEAGLISTARYLAPATVALVRQSEVRAEEFARRLAAALGLAIAGETDERSRQRLDAIDYKRLLAEAEQAKAAAQAQMEKLRKKQEELDLRRRRGKH